MLGDAPSGIHHIATTPACSAGIENRTPIWILDFATPNFCSHNHSQTTSATRIRRQFDISTIPQIPRHIPHLPIGCTRPPSSCHQSGHVLGASLPAWTRSRPRDFERGNSTTSPPSSVSAEIHSKNDSLDTNIKARRYGCPDCHCLTCHQLTDPLLGLMLCASVDEEQVRPSPPAIPSVPRLTQYSLTDYSPKPPSPKSRARSARSSANSRATPRPRRRWTAGASTRCTTSSTRTSSS